MADIIDILIRKGLNFAANALLDNYGMQPQQGTVNDPPQSDIPEIGDVPAVRAIITRPGAVVLILGARQSGKTILSLRLAELIGKPTYCIWPEQVPPQPIIPLQLEHIAVSPPPRSTLLIDDAPVVMSSRDYHKAFSQEVERLIPVVRHRRRLHLIISAQASSMADRYVLDSDLICLKAPSKLFLSLERPAVVRLYRDVAPIFAEMSEREQQRHVYIYTGQFAGLVRVDKPHFLSR